MHDPHRSPRMAAFPCWLLAFYLAWASIVALGGWWPSVRSHWPISAAMAGGSFVAGSSPVAGGVVGFPVLVYAFDYPARLGRDFCLAVQSVGLASAGLYILTRRRPVEWRILRFAMAGAALGMPLGLAFVAPRVSDARVKVLFSIVYASFGLLHLARMRGIIANVGPLRIRFAADPGIGVAVGFAGGLLASILGVGAEILLYGLLALLYHADVKAAIPTAVLLMAFTSIVGMACRLLSPDAAPMIAQIAPSWLAAAPVVVLGAPVGSFVARFVRRPALLGFVSLLCLAQYAFTCYHNHLAGWPLTLAIAGVLAVNLALHLLFEFGRRALLHQAGADARTPPAAVATPLTGA
ncbi:MAG: sulfite exporter TauE/SafE family protein [Isosphaeraceae bacterium]